MRRQPLLQSRNQSRDFDGLGHVIIHARRPADLLVALHGIGSHGDDRHAVVEHAGLRIADLARGRQAIQLRHLHVHQHQVIGDSAKSLDGFQAVGGHFDPHPQFLENAHRHLLVGDVVLGHENPGGS